MILFVWLNKPDSKTPETSSTYMTDHPSRHTVTKMDVEENPGEPTCECGLAILRNPSEPTNPVSPRYGNAELGKIRYTFC